MKHYILIRPDYSEVIEGFILEITIDELRDFIDKTKNLDKTEMIIKYTESIAYLDDNLCLTDKYLSGKNYRILTKEEYEDITENVSITTQNAKLLVSNKEMYLVFMNDHFYDESVVLDPKELLKELTKE